MIKNVLLVLALIVVTVAACESVAGDPVKEPQKLDCDLIFPGPSVNVSP
jgi:hypothetical protein